MDDVQVVEQGAPFRILAEDRVHEPDHRPARRRHDGGGAGPRRRQPLTPHKKAIGLHVAVEVRVEVGAR